MSALGRAVPKGCRLEVFFARMARHRPFTSFGDADQGITTILEAVEDELTDIPNDPSTRGEDGRLYPPQPDSWRTDTRYRHVTRMRAKLHNIFVSASGAVEIRPVGSDVILLSKVDARGREVWDHE
jgi:hypothetical protein